AFEGRKWRWSLPLQRAFGRRAAAVIVTNPVHENLVKAWPARAMIIADPPPKLATSSPDSPAQGGRQIDDQGFVFVIATYGPYEARGSSTTPSLGSRPASRMSWPIRPPTRRT